MKVLELKIKESMKSAGLRPVDVYRHLEINRVNFYKAIKTSNLKNKSLGLILNFLGLKVEISLRKIKNEKAKN